MPFWLSKQNRCNANDTISNDMFVRFFYGYFLQFAEQNQKTLPEEKCQNTCTLIKMYVRSKGKTIEPDPNLSKFYCKD